ncbi:MAG: peptidylprolyl isomerase [Planctomycetaceae bacterium]
MRRASLSLLGLGLLAATGCDLLKPKVENPIFGPPPPRISMTDEGSPLAGGKPAAGDLLNEPLGHSQVVTVGLTESERQPVADPVNRNQVVATVNGVPVFAGEVLDRYAVALTEAAGQMPPAEFERQRRELIQRDLDHHIERKLLLSRLRRTLKKEQFEMLSNYIDQKFAEEVERLMAQFNVNTRHELEIELKKQQTSLDDLGAAFANQRMAMEFLGAKAGTNLQLGRPELMQYYRDHLDDYAITAKVLWQQIEINFAQHGGRPEAFAVLETVVEELKNGEDFGVVARAHSDGPRAAHGGQWDWTSAGSLADEELEEVLFTLPVGKISRIIVGENSYRLVQVNDRTPAGHTPFEDVQHAIRTTLEDEARRRAAEQIIAELKAAAIIETMFDEGPKETRIALPFR